MINKTDDGEFKVLFTDSQMTYTVEFSRQQMLMKSTAICV